MRRKGKGQLLTNRQKEVIRLKKRYDQLWQAKSKLPLLPLPKPVRAGWERNFVVREDVKKGPHGRFLESLLTKINNTVHCRSKDFKEYNWRTNKIEPIEQELRVLYDKEYEVLTTQEKAQFNKMYITIRRWYAVEKVLVWVVKQPWRFVFKIKPYFLTHRVEDDGNIESELELINRKLWVYGIAYKYGDHGHHYKDYSDIPYKKIKEELLDKEMEDYD